MKDSEYPSTAIVLEVLFGLIGLMGMGHIYLGDFFSGVCVLIAYLTFLCFEGLVVNISAFPYNVSFTGLIFFIFIQNLFIALYSANYVRMKRSNDFAKGLFTLMGFVLIMVFVIVEITQEDKVLRTGALFVLIITLLATSVVLKSTVFKKEKELKDTINSVDREVTRSGASLYQEKEQK